MGANIRTCGEITSVLWRDTFSTVRITAIHLGIPSVLSGIPSVLWRLFITVGDDISTVGDSFSTVEGIQDIGR